MTVRGSSSEATRRRTNTQRWFAQRSGGTRQLDGVYFAEAITRAELEGDASGSSASAAPAWLLGVCGEAPFSRIPPSPPEGASAGGGVDEPRAVDLGHARMVAATRVWRVLRQ